MNRYGDIRTASLLVALAAFVGSVSVGAAEVAERPEWKVGDKWTFRATENPGTKETTWSREVVGVPAEDRVFVHTDSGKRLTFDGEGNSLDGRGAEYTWRRFKFPMSAGMSWSHERKIAWEGAQGEERSNWRVTSYEKVTVPAGTFDCFKVEGEANGSWNGRLNAGYGRSRTRTTYWYCPAINWAAKWEIENVAYVTAPRVITVSELVSFEHKP